MLGQPSMINMTTIAHKIILLVERPHMQNNLHQKQLALSVGELVVGELVVCL